MSAAFQLPVLWGASSVQARPAVRVERNENVAPAQISEARQYQPEAAPPVSLAFYRKHTERTLRRYLYASIQVGRAPSVLSDPVARGWMSSRRVRTFEDALIFVLDVERCLNQLGMLDRQLLSRIVLQEYTQAETATLMGMSVRSVSSKFSLALDRLTEKLIAMDLLVIPN